MEETSKRIRKIKNFKIRKNIFKMFIPFITFFLGAYVIVLGAELNIKIGLIVNLGGALIIFSILYGVFLIAKVSFETYSFEGKIAEIAINEKDKMKKIENELKKDNSPVIITEDYLVVFNSDFIPIDEIEEINFKVYKDVSPLTKKILGIMTNSISIREMASGVTLSYILRHKRLGLDIKSDDARVGRITVDICRARYIDEFGKREIENKIEKLKELVKQGASYNGR